MLESVVLPTLQIVHKVPCDLNKASRSRLERGQDYTLVAGGSISDNNELEAITSHLCG